MVAPPLPQAACLTRLAIFAMLSPRSWGLSFARHRLQTPRPAQRALASSDKTVEGEQANGNAFTTIALRNPWHKHRTAATAITFDRAAPYRAFLTKVKNRSRVDAGSCCCLSTEDSNRILYLRPPGH
jgi:hypothetical protein